MPTTRKGLLKPEDLVPSGVRRAVNTVLAWTAATSMNPNGTAGHGVRFARRKRPGHAREARTITTKNLYQASRRSGELNFAGEKPRPEDDGIARADGSTMNPRVTSARKITKAVEWKGVCLHRTTEASRD